MDDQTIAINRLNAELCLVVSKLDLAVEALESIVDTYDPLKIAQKGLSEIEDLGQK
tara:strand:+ start:1422 stop:1589 length:168 start_codon:yes stop_codon:yes gene_type:complete